MHDRVKADAVPHWQRPVEHSESSAPPAEHYFGMISTIPGLIFTVPLS
jgi:hypothetical protein